MAGAELRPQFPTTRAAPGQSAVSHPARTCATNAPSDAVCLEFYSPPLFQYYRSSGSFISTAMLSNQQCSIHARTQSKIISIDNQILFSTSSNRFILAPVPLADQYQDPWPGGLADTVRQSVSGSDPLRTTTQTHSQPASASFAVCQGSLPHPHRDTRRR